MSDKKDFRIINKVLKEVQKIFPYASLFEEEEEGSLYFVNHYNHNRMHYLWRVPVGNWLVNDADRSMAFIKDQAEEVVHEFSSAIINKF